MRLIVGHRVEALGRHACHSNGVLSDRSSMLRSAPFGVPAVLMNVLSTELLKELKFAANPCYAFGFVHPAVLTIRGSRICEVELLQHLAEKVLLGRRETVRRYTVDERL